MILFSDLHLSPRTFDTCMKVLKMVHKEAKERNVSVGFLGDFFDHVYNKGTLPVDILNSLLRYFEQEWSVPMIMIPGNHDYFDASETEHGLTPFKYASSFITVIDEPTIIARQLWVPWRRSTSVIEQILSSHKDVDVIFGHFDIIGFKLSAKHISTEGVSETLFPSDTPVYSGHYHTPQHHNNIRYLGSPYQLTLSEAEDKKALLLLDPKTLRVAEIIPIHIGRRQYKWSVEELLARKNELRPDDRVSVTAKTDDCIQDTVDTLIQNGIHVDVKKALAPIVTRLEEVQENKPIDLLQAYGQRHSIDTSKRSWAFMKDWIKNWTVSSTLQIKNICPVRIRVEGFGPFPGPLSFALQGQGFTLVSGQQDDRPNASNGVGKSMITAGAWLWVCTGSIDHRGSIAFDESAGVIHGNEGKALVCVEGTIGSSTWSIERSLTCGRKRKHTLRYFMNDVEKTRSTLSATQRAICIDLFGLDVTGAMLYEWLVQHSVWSQHASRHRWIDANETQAKTQIQPLANMDIWCAMYTEAKQNKKDTEEEIKCLKMNIEHTIQNKKDAEKRYEYTKSNARIWEVEHGHSINKSMEDLAQTRQSLEEATLACGHEEVKMSSDNETTLQNLNRSLIEKRNMLARVKFRMDQLRKHLDSSWLLEDINVIREKAFQKEVPDTKKTAKAKEHCLAALHARKVILEDKLKQYDRMKKEDICPSCKRPFEKHEDHDEQVLRQEKDIQLAQQNVQSAEHDFQQAHDVHKKAVAEKNEVVSLLENINNTIEFKKQMIVHDKALEETEALVKRIKTLSDIMKAEEARVKAYEHTRRIRDDLLRALTIMTRNHEILVSRQCPYVPDQTEIDTLKIKLDQLECQLKQLYSDHAMWKEAIQFCGPRGIQTYAMEHTVQKLAMTTTTWLQKLFHTKDISLKAYFDEKERLHRHVDLKHCSGIMSGGQWRRVQLASFLAWRDMCSYNFPLLIMDEPCTSMDEVGIRDVQETLRDWCEGDPQRTCFFITHEPGQHRDTSVYHNHTKILHKRGRSSIIDNPTANKRIRK